MPDDAPFVPPEEKPWPPREGMRFFLLWSAGVLAPAMLTRAAWWFTTMRNPNASQLNTGWIALGVVAAAWQAWLLFAFGRRFAAWVGITLFIYAAPFIFRGGGFGYWPLVSFVVPVLETLLLNGVRARPWGWLVASFCGGLLTTLGSLVFNTSGTSWAEWLAEQLPVRVSSVAIISSVYSGLWLLGELVAAAALAWWMPPLAHTGRRGGAIALRPDR